MFWSSVTFYEVCDVFEEKVVKVIKRIELIEAFQWIKQLDAIENVKKEAIRRLFNVNK